MEQAFAFIRAGHDPNVPVTFRDQVLTGGRVRDRYLVGMLAPRGTLATEPGRSERSLAAAGIAEGSDDPATDDTTAPAMVQRMGNSEPCG